MPATSPSTSQSSGRTFLVAVCVLGVGALVQFGAVGWAFVARFHARPPAAITEPEALVVTDTFGDPQPSVGAITPPPKPTPVAAKPKPLEIEPESRFAELIEQGKVLRERGDATTALTRFREAQALDPRNPLALAETAVTYEKMGQPEKGADMWRRIYEMGESAGVYYSAAEAKLKSTQAQAMVSALSVQPKTEPKFHDDSGIPEGSKLGILDVTRSEEREPQSLRKFTLRVPVKARSRTRIDVRDVTIHILFYDIINDRTVVQTSANVSSKWLSTPPDWSDDDVETLSIEYQQPLPDARQPAENRKFFGYVARVYYKEQLQDSQAEPEKLAQQFPPPRNVPQTPTP